MILLECKGEEMNDFMNIYTVSFFGHRELYDLRSIDKQLEPILHALIKRKSYISFLIGRNGAFDEYVASVIKRIQKEVGKDNNDMTLVLPYAVADLEYYKRFYDYIFIPDSVEGVHPKSAITLRNRWMVEQSDLVIFNVMHKNGGAFAAMKYAKALNKKIINLGESEQCNFI